MILHGAAATLDFTRPAAITMLGILRVLPGPAAGRTGLVPCPRWRPDPDDADGARDMDEYCALGRT